jgi:hypothetical protein
LRSPLPATATGAKIIGIQTTRNEKRKRIETRLGLDEEAGPERRSDDGGNNDTRKSLARGGNTRKIVAAAYEDTGDMLASDPGCWIMGE